MILFLISIVIGKILHVIIVVLLWVVVYASIVNTGIVWVVSSIIGVISGIVDQSAASAILLVISNVIDSS